MSGRLIVVTGTDTGIGKTHLSEALLVCARSRGQAAVGYKPIESGVDGSAPTDAERLAAASDPALLFHVKRAPSLALRLPISPHLAAEQEGVTLPWEEIRAAVGAIRAQVDVLVELPGGLATPLSPNLLNVQALHALSPDVAVLVAPDRLGVLHHALSALMVARANDMAIAAVALMAPAKPDASSGTNARELSRFTTVPVLGPWPRGGTEELAARPATAELTRRWLEG